MRPVLVTTAHRGVFFGYLPRPRQKLSATQITLSRARLCLYWSSGLRGFMGLATDGPDASCRIGPAATITLYDITSVVEVTPAAADKWEQAPWSL